MGLQGEAHEGRAGGRRVVAAPPCSEPMVWAQDLEEPEESEAAHRLLPAFHRLDMSKAKYEVVKRVEVQQVSDLVTVLEDNWTVQMEGEALQNAAGGNYRPKGTIFTQGECAENEEVDKATSGVLEVAVGAGQVDLDP
ncbi:hypothetical protein CYMTET_34010, partial [Cymbomonas tetramitiformis]